MFKQWRINRIKIKMAGLDIQIIRLEMCNRLNVFQFELLLRLKKQSAELNEKLTILDKGKS